MITTADLKSVFYAKKRFERCRLKYQEARESIGIHAVQYDGVGGSGRVKSDSKLERDVIKLNELENALIDAELSYKVAAARLWVRFYDLPDSRARLIFRYRHIDLLSWKEIARIMQGEIDTEDAARQYHNRYMKESGLFETGNKADEKEQKEIGPPSAL